MATARKPLIQDGGQLRELPSGDTLTGYGHAAQLELIHLAMGGGPFEGFASGAFREVLPASDPFPTSVTWWTSAAKTAKIVDHTLTYNANKTIATSVWRVYAADGTTVALTATDTMTYSGIFETSRTRSLT